MSGRDLLFATWDGGGNVPPMLSVAGAMSARGHRVRVLADPVLEDDVRRAGCEFVSWRTAPRKTARGKDGDILRDFELPPGPGALLRLRDRLLAGPAADFARDTLAEIDRRRPDVCAFDAFLFGTLAASESRGIPTAALVPNIYMFPAPGLPAFGPGFAPARGLLGRLRDRFVGWQSRRLWDAGLPAFNAARAGLGLAPLATLLEQPDRAQRVLVLTSKAFDFEADALPANVRYVGPRLEDPSWIEEWTPPWEDDARPLVLVGMSTTFQAQETALRRVIAALGALPARGLVTAGHALDPRDFPAPPNVAVVRTAPHAAVLRRAAACLTHAGHGTVIRSLAASVPVVCMPMGRDQNDNAARVVERGAGLQLSPDAGEPAIRHALARVLAEPGFKRAAGRLAAAIAVETAQDAAVAELEALLPAAARLEPVPV